MFDQNKLLAVGIEGSPRRTGNSTALLKAYLKGVASVGFDTKSIYLNGLSYKGCHGCDQCVKREPCKLNDDLNEVFPALARANIWAMASPIYYDGVSGQLKMFYDRLRFTSYDPNKLEGPRRGIVIVTYEDARSEDYFKTASALAKYLNWNNRGDFGEVKVFAESNMGPRDAWKSRPDLIEKLRKAGIAQAVELMELV
jgi:multimeric flavodoxin WrbA